VSGAGNEERQAIIDACRRMNTLGINQGKPSLLLSDEVERVRGEMAGDRHAGV
jgi:hypothetical protein